MEKFAYSLMLRLGLRLTKVDVNLSKDWVTKAINGGVILNSADNAIMKYTDSRMISTVIRLHLIL